MQAAVRRRGGCRAQAPGRGRAQPPEVGDPVGDRIPLDMDRHRDITLYHRDGVAAQEGPVARILDGSPNRRFTRTSRRTSSQRP